MTKIRFSDGMEFDTSGDLRIETRPDGLYVVGRGALIPVADAEEGNRVIEMFTKFRAAPQSDKTD